MQFPSFIFSGPSGVGKTFTCNVLADAYKDKYVFMHGLTRQIEEEYGGREKILKNPKIRKEFQRTVAYRTAGRLVSCLEILERTPNEKPVPSFLFDRGLDFLMYEALYSMPDERVPSIGAGSCLKSTLDMPVVKNAIRLIRSLAEGGKIVNMLCVYGPSQLSTTNGEYTNIEAVMRQATSMQMLLEMAEIPYVLAVGGNEAVGGNDNLVTTAKNIINQ